MFFISSSVIPWYERSSLNNGSKVFFRVFVLILLLYKIKHLNLVSADAVLFGAFIVLVQILSNKLFQLLLPLRRYITCIGNTIRRQICCHEQTLRSLPCWLLVEDAPSRTDRKCRTNPSLAIPEKKIQSFARSVSWARISSEVVVEHARIWNHKYSDNVAPLQLRGEAARTNFTRVRGCYARICNDYDDLVSFADIS